MRDRLPFLLVMAVLVAVVVAVIASTPRAPASVAPTVSAPPADCFAGRRSTPADWKPGDSVYIGADLYGTVTRNDPDWRPPNGTVQRGRGISIRFPDGTTNTFLASGLTGYYARC